MDIVLFFFDMKSKEKIMLTSAFVYDFYSKSGVESFTIASQKNQEKIRFFLSVDGTLNFSLTVESILDI
jgi:hypothetical protein